MSMSCHPSCGRGSSLFCVLTLRGAEDWQKCDLLVHKKSQNMDYRSGRRKMDLVEEPCSKTRLTRATPRKMRGSAI